MGVREIATMEIASHCCLSPSLLVCVCCVCFIFCVKISKIGSVDVEHGLCVIFVYIFC